jgi:hypothetical protein
MMLPGEKISDPNVAAFYVRYGGMRIVVIKPALIRLSWWDRLFTWDPWEPQVPIADHTPLGPDECQRDGSVLYMGDKFHTAMRECADHLRERAALAP